MWRNKAKQESELLEKAWNLLEEWKPVNPSPDFKARFWQRVAQEELAAERKPVFVSFGLSPRLAPALATLALLLVFTVYSMRSFLTPSPRQLALLTKNEDIQMLENLELAEDLDAIQNINTLEDFEMINSMEL